MTQQIEIGRLLRAGTTGFIAGCRVNQLDAPSFGALVRAPLTDTYQIFGVIYDIHIDDDGLVRQLVTADNVSAEVMKDNRERRIVPVEMSVLAVGYEQDGRIFHLLPPRPPLPPFQPSVHPPSIHASDVLPSPAKGALDDDEPNCLAGGDARVDARWICRVRR